MWVSVQLGLRERLARKLVPRASRPMARLKVAEPPQHGARTGGEYEWQGRARKKRSSPTDDPSPPSTPEAAGSDDEHRRPTKRRCSLTPNRQAAIAVAYERLPGRKNSAEWRGALSELCSKYDVGARYPAKVATRLAEEGKLPSSRKGTGGRPMRIGEEEAEELENSPSRERLRHDIRRD